MGADEQKVRAWKDELPRRGRAWYGGFLAGRGSFLSPDLLRLLYSGAGGVDDHEVLPLSQTAHAMARALATGPLPTAELRRLVGDRSRYQRAVAELQRHLLVTSVGGAERRSGWPAVLLALTVEAFDVGGRHDRVAAADRFLDTVLQTTPVDLSRAFRWSLPQARACLDELTATVVPPPREAGWWRLLVAGEAKRAQAGSGEHRRRHGDQGEQRQRQLRAYGRGHVQGVGGVAHHQPGQCE